MSGAMPAWVQTVLAIASWGLVIGGWALIVVWARGKRGAESRWCAKCLYDMTGLPGLRCPECGREAKNEKQLRRRKRRWWALAVGFVLFVLNYAMWVPGRVQHEGWTGLIPTPVLCLGVSWLPGPGPTDRTRPGWWQSPDPRAFSTESLSLLESAARVLSLRMRNGEMGPRLRSLVHRVAYARIEADMERHPPEACWWMRFLLESASTHQHPRMAAEYAALIAPVIKLHPTIVAGSPVYAEIDGEGFGDLAGFVEVSTEWQGGRVEIVDLHTDSSRLYHEFITYSTGIPPHIVNLGTAVAGARSLVVKTTVLGRGGISADRRVYAVREAEFPITVLSRDDDPLIGVEADIGILGERIAARLWALPGAKLSVSLRPRGEGEILPRGRTLGARVEIRAADGRVLVTGECCLWAGADSKMYGWGGNENFRAASVRLSATSAGDDSELPPATRIRFICDRDIARQNPNCREYYEGEFELPVSTVWE